MLESLRVGLGFDVHRLAPGLPLWLGGVNIEHDFGLVGHSDADVLLHALIDALLGAAGLGDIGEHFPDTAEAYHRIDSKILVSKVLALVTPNYRIVNVDANIITEQPKLSRHKQRIRETISQLLTIDIGCVNIKAKTNERLGYIGAGEAIEAQVIVLLAQKT